MFTSSSVRLLFTNHLKPYLIAPPPPPVETPRNPCSPSPCGPNAECKEKSGAGSCACFPDYFGDPYTGCRPECVLNSDCTRSKACIGNKCRDPCIQAACGNYTECRVTNHSPACNCLAGYTGDPLVSCTLIPLTTSTSKHVNVNFFLPIFSVTVIYIGNKSIAILILTLSIY